MITIIIITVIISGIFIILMALSLIFDFMEKVENIIYSLYFIQILLLVAIGVMWHAERI